MSIDLLKSYILEILKEEESKRWSLLPAKKLYIWDLDDTLVHSNSKILVTKSNGTVLALTSHEYAMYEREPEDEFDFSEFQELIEPETIDWTTNILKSVIAKRGTSGAVILTARSTDRPAKQFLKMNNLPEIPIVALDDSHPERKAQWILAMIKRFGYTEIEFFDDSAKNIQAVNSLKSKVPMGVKIITRLVNRLNPQRR